MSSSSAATPAGYLVLDKPLGKTSMQACAAIRARLRNAGAPKRIKVGHAGTLDPLATGVLVILVGKATKLQDRVMAGRKSYIADVDLGQRSQTDDREGPIEPVSVAEPPTAEIIQQTLLQFVGTIQQRPPAYSAMKIDGRRAYKLARESSRTNTDIPVLEPRPVRIDAIRLTRYDWPIATLEIDCGKGTYIRSLARDLGVALKTGGMLHALRRTRVGEHTIENATTLEDLPENLLQEHLLSVERLGTNPGQPVSDSD